MGRTGVFVCHCGLNIAGTISIEKILDAIRNDPDVVILDSQYLCSTNGTGIIASAIKQKQIDRVVIAACTPKLHESLFRDVLAEAGLNPYLMEIANIREQCSWVHDDQEQATQKAIDLIRMAIAAVRQHEPLVPPKVQVQRKALIIGGGIAGITTALRLADAGLPVILVEKSPTIGGHMAMLDKTFPSLDCSICVLAPLMTEVERHPLITLWTNSEVAEVNGSAGNFSAKIIHHPRCIDEEKCRGCISTCADPCPIEVPSEWDMEMKPRKAIYLPFAQASPQLPVIDWEHCIGCRNCEAYCDHDAIRLEQQSSVETVNVGAIVLATGFSLFDPKEKPELGYNVFADTITSLELERLLNPSGPTNGRVIRPSTSETPRRIAFILCVGSRDEAIGAPFCSRICCMASIKQALELKERLPEAEITIFYQDIRAYGKAYEEMYLRALEQGIKFVRGRPSRVLRSPSTNELYVRSEDTLHQHPIEAPVDLVVLMTGVRPEPSTTKLAEILRIERSPDSFWKERHPKLRVTEASRPGIFLSGSCQGVKDIQDTVAHAGEAAAKVLGLLSRNELALDPFLAVIDQSQCVKCGICLGVCPFQAIIQNESSRQLSVQPTACTGCGACVSACPKGAIKFPGYSDPAIESMIDAATANKRDCPLVIGFLCNWCGYDGVDFAGVSRMKYPVNIRPIRVLCTARVDPSFVTRALQHGADGVLIVGCHPQDCHYKVGFARASRRVEYLQDALRNQQIAPQRLKIISIAGSEGQRFQDELRGYIEALTKMGPLGTELRDKKTHRKEECPP